MKIVVLIISVVVITIAVAHGSEINCVLRARSSVNPLTCDFVNITDSQFTINATNLNTSAIKWIFFNESSIETFPSGIFENFTNITNFFMENVGLTEITPGSFMNASTLLTLNLDHNKIEVLEANAFEGAENLINLYLGFNKVREVNVEAFYGLAKLRYIGLQNNSITHFKTGTFNNLTDLVYLHLNYNQLRELTNDLFEHNQKLKKLALRFNKISYIDEKLAERMKNFTIASLNGNLCTNFNLAENLTSELSECTVPVNETMRIGARSLNLDESSMEKSGGFMLGFIIITLVCLPGVVGLVLYLRYLKKKENIDTEMDSI